MSYEHHEWEQLGYLKAKEQETYKITPGALIGEWSGPSEGSMWNWSGGEVSVWILCTPVCWWVQRNGTLKCLGLWTLESYKLKFPSRKKLCSEKKLLEVDSKLSWASPNNKKKVQRKKKFQIKRRRWKDTE